MNRLLLATALLLALATLPSVSAAPFCVKTAACADIHTDSDGLHASASVAGQAGVGTYAGTNGAALGVGVGITHCVTSVDRSGHIEVWHCAF